MEFALFYEIPVPAPWGADSERLAYQHTLEEAVAGDRHGWDAFWTVEHHFLWSSRTAPTPRCSTGPSRPAPSGSASATASA